MFKWLKNRAEKRQNVKNARNLYMLAAQHAQNPQFYHTFQVSDSVSGRYELLCIHLFLLLLRLRKDDVQKLTSQHLTEFMVKDLEGASREINFQEFSAPNNVNKLIAGFFERSQEYEKGLHQGRRAYLEQVVSKYVFGLSSLHTKGPDNQPTTEQRVENLAIYILSVHSHLKSIPIQDIETANFAFLAPDI